jgi:hypothetical protein
MTPCRPAFPTKRSGAPGPGWRGRTSSSASVARRRAPVHYQGQGIDRPHQSRLASGHLPSREKHHRESTGPPEHPFPQCEVRLNPQEVLVQRDEVHNVEDPLWRHVIEVEAVEV